MASTPTGIVPSAQRGIPLSKISPAFLHANSTSHTWAFSAFAEIIDNAYDPDVSASELLIDKVDIRNVACLIFLDNGAGMDRDKLHKMLSFGFCEKDIFETSATHQPIGHYGNGFKSGSMRIGTDAIVFTRSDHSASIGFLSQTYLNAIKAESVFVPILEYRLPKLERFKSQESRNNLNAILTYSVFKFEEELKAELRALEGSKTGTKIIISNLKRLENGNLELDFSSDPTDIRCPEAHEADMTSVYHRPVEQYTSEYKLSLREYCSILFLKPRMKITIRGHRVKSKLISKSLSQSEQDTYNPTWLTTPVKIIFGFTCEKERSEDYGLMLYHRNRLIKAFERVGYQKQPNDRGVGVVGVAQVDFLQPIHNKQDFKWDEKFNSVMKAFATKLNEYWNEKMNTGNPANSQQNGNLPDWTWAQCDHCLKWRRLPDSINPESLPEKWYCRYNADGIHNRCDVPEEPEDEDLAVKPRFEKTFKKRQEEQKRQLRLRQIEEEKKKKQEMEKQLRQKEEELRVLQQLKQPVVDPCAHKLEQALAQAQRRIEEQARLMEQMSSGVFPSLPLPPPRKTQQNDSKFPPLAQSSPVSFLHNQQTKRRATVESLPTKENKKLCIKTETGEVLAITCNFGDDEDGADQDLSNNTASKKTPKTKQGTKGIPLKVAMPFHAPKTNLEKSKEIHEAEQKQDSPMGANSPAKPHVEGSKSKNTNENLNFIDLTADDESLNHAVIKPDPDTFKTSSTHETGQETMDVKPDKEKLDGLLRKNIEEGMNCVEQCAAAEFSSQFQTGSNSANEKQRNISETIESNLETALAAIKERADKEKLGTDAPRGNHHQEQAASSASSSVLETTSHKIPSPNTSGPSLKIDELIGQSTQASKFVASDFQRLPDMDESAKISQNTKAGKCSRLGEENSEKSRLAKLQNELSEKGFSSNVEDNLILPSINETSETYNNDAGCKLIVNNIQEKGDSCEKQLAGPSGVLEKLSNSAEKEALSITDSENCPVLNDDLDVVNISSNKSIEQCSNPDGLLEQSQDRSDLEQFYESPTNTADNSTDHVSSQIVSTKSLMQLTQPQISQTDKKSVPEAEKSLSCPASNVSIFSSADAGAHSDANDSSVQCSSNERILCEKSNACHQNSSLPEQRLLFLTQQNSAEEELQTMKDSAEREASKNKSSHLTQEKTTLSIHVQTEVDVIHEESSQAALDKMRKNVYRLLQLLVPEKDLGDISNIDKLVEDMVRDGEQSSQSQSLSENSLELV